MNAGHCGEHDHSGHIHTHASMDTYEARTCYSAGLLVPRRMVTASASQTRIIVILLCLTTSKSLLNTKLSHKSDLNCVHEDEL